VPLDVSLSADLVLLDLQPDSRRALDLCRRIKSTAQGKRLPVVLLANLCASNDVIAGLTAGAEDFVAKPFDPDVLAAKLRALLRFSNAKEERHASSYALPELVAQRVADLCFQSKVSARERQVLDLLLLGRSNEEIAQVLGFKARTAKFHQVNLLKKLGADSRADLLRILL
jgi:DNA-binding NarL/FixJ family response regulator